MKKNLLIVCLIIMSGYAKAQNSFDVFRDDYLRASYSERQQQLSNLNAERAHYLSNLIIEDIQSRGNYFIKTPKMKRNGDVLRAPKHGVIYENIAVDNAASLNKLIFQPGALLASMSDQVNNCSDHSCIVKVTDIQRALQVALFKLNSDFNQNYSFLLGEINMEFHLNNIKNTLQQMRNIVVLPDGDKIITHPGSPQEYHVFRVQQIDAFGYVKIYQVIFSVTADSRFLDYANLEKNLDAYKLCLINLVDNLTSNENDCGNGLFLKKIKMEMAPHLLQ